MPLMWILCFFVFFFLFMVKGIFYSEIMIFNTDKCDFMKGNSFEWLW